MIGLLGRIFGTPGAIRDVAKAARDGIDSLVYTKEEKAQDKSRSDDKERDAILDWLRSTQGQNLARRIIGIGVFLLWSGMWACAGLSHIISIWVSDAARWVSTSEALFAYANEISGEFLVVLTFYFGAPMAGKAIDALLTRRLASKE